jgi:hypothetical protein
VRRGSLRDVCYNNTTSALCEHVDNAIEAGANEIRIYFRQRGPKGSYEIDAAVYDNGRGMSPNVLKMATAFGGSMRYGNREGIGRFGMGMKTAALSMSPMMELYSWQEKSAFYKMTLDVEDIGKDRANSVELPDPTFSTDLPPGGAESDKKSIAIDPAGLSFIPLQLPLAQFGSLRSGLNPRTTWRFSALMTPILASIVGRHGLRRGSGLPSPLAIPVRSARPWEAR